jgi:hypothetical protein
MNACFLGTANPILWEYGNNDEILEVGTQSIHFVVGGGHQQQHNTPAAFRRRLVEHGGGVICTVVWVPIRIIVLARSSVPFKFK